MIGGNTIATIQVKEVGKNTIGEQAKRWVNLGTVLGFLDFVSNQNENPFRGKVQNTSHIFLCDHSRWVVAGQGATVTPERIRMVVNNEVFNVLLIDDPMGMHQHLEIYLEYLGGGLIG